MNLLITNCTKVFLQFFVLFIVAFTQTQAQCTIVPGQNTVYGFTWDDSNGNGTKQPSEGFLENIGIDLYLDANANGVIDTGESIVDSDITDVNGEYTLVAPLVTETENVADFFNFPSYSGNNGSLNWSNSWQEVGENDGVSVGNIKVANALRFGRNAFLDTDITGYGALRDVDLSTYTTAQFSFNFTLASPSQKLKALSNLGSIIIFPDLFIYPYFFLTLITNRLFFVSNVFKLIEMSSP